MEGAGKFILDYFQYRLSLLVSGGKNYERWKAANHGLKRVEIKNKKLANELEKACTKNEGFLTFSEFLLIDQFGENGYHATHTDHGLTSTYRHWGPAIASLCQKNNISHVLDFGSETGELGIEIIKAAKKSDQKITWSGIELNKALHSETRAKFSQHKLKDNLGEVVTSLNQLKTNRKSIILFSYSLDSVPPELFLNTTSQKSYPNALVGISVKNGVLSEIILDPIMLKTRGIKFENGMFTNEHGQKFDLSKWTLHPRQKANICIPALSILADFSNRFPTSIFLIIDEFRPPVATWDTSYLCSLRDLHKYKRDIENMEKFYQDAGNTLLYHPTFFLTFYKFLNSLGFSSVRYEIEQKMARELVGETWLSPRSFLTYAFIAKDKKTRRNTFRLELPRIKIF